jgi:hypothetical protein
MRQVRLSVNIDNHWYSIPQDQVVDIKNFCEKNMGKRATLLLKIEESRRSVEQNAYYWGVVVAGFMKLWPDVPKNEVHRLLGDEVRKFRRSENEIKALRSIHEKHEKSFTEDDEWYIKSSSEMSVSQFWIMCEQATILLLDIGGSLNENEGRMYKRLREENVEIERERKLFID